LRFPATLVDGGEIIQVAGQLGLSGPRSFFPQGDGLFEKRRSFRQPVLCAPECRQTIQARSDIPVFRSEDCLADFEHALQQRLRGGEISAGFGAQRQAFEGVGVIRMLSAYRLAKNTNGFLERLLGLRQALGPAVQRAQRFEEWATSALSGATFLRTARPSSSRGSALS